jgi:hypothetical protein
VLADRTAPRPLLQVRLEFLRVLGDWMLRLRERLDHEQRLLPYVLSALSDESPGVRVGAARQVLRLRCTLHPRDRALIQRPDGSAGGP